MAEYSGTKLTELAASPAQILTLSAPSNELTRPELLVFADDWGRHPSSCQHLIQRLRGDYRILWANTIGTRSPRADRFTFRRGLEKLNNWRRGLRQLDDCMWVLDLPMLPKIGSAAASYLNSHLVGWRLRQAFRQAGFIGPKVITTVPLIGPLIRHVPHASLIYYCTDDYSQWPGAERQALKVAEAETAREAALTLAVSEVLRQRLATYGRAEYFPHGVDCAHFAKVHDSAVAEPLSGLPRPRIGFFGLIYEKLNFDLLTAIAKKFHQGSLILIGRIDFCPDTFRRSPNVHLLGPQPYADLPRWLAGFDVLLLPYVDDEMIRQSCPLKLRECLASGKPTVSIDVPEVRKFAGNVAIAADKAAYLAAIENALVAQTAEQIRQRQQAVAADDWSHKADQLRDFLEALP